MIWTVLGISVAIVAIFCISLAESLVGIPIFEQHREYIAGALAIAGVAAWFIGRYLSGKRRAMEEAGGNPSKRFLLFDLRYWGPMLLVLGIITLFIRPLRKTKEEMVQAPPKPAPKVVAQVEKPKPPPPKVAVPIVFPTFKMQGVFFRESRPFAIISGQSYAVGDHLGEVTVKAIGRSSVLLELSGQEKLLTLN